MDNAEPDIATLAQVIATLFVALAIEGAALIVYYPRPSAGARRGLLGWLATSTTTIAGAALAILAIDCFMLAGVGDANTGVGIMNVVVIACMSALVVLAPVAGREAASHGNRPVAGGVRPRAHPTNDRPPSAWGPGAT